LGAADTCPVDLGVPDGVLAEEHLRMALIADGVAEFAFLMGMILTSIW
jgi:hypothetical protein